MAIALANLSEIHFQLNRADKAEETGKRSADLLIQLLDSNPNDHKLKSLLAGRYDQLGQIRAAQGDFQGAIEQFGRVSELANGSPQLIYRLAAAYARAYSTCSEFPTDRPLSEVQLIELRGSALNHLQEAIERGYGNAQMLEADDAWTAFRDDSRFLDLLSSCSE
jgi:tetratricopeptide (TPR) repeat protein